MIKLLIQTFASKVLTAVFTLAIVMLTSHVLGAGGRGEVSLITADIGIIILFVQIIGGPSIVYLVPRTNGFHLFICSVIWAIAMPLCLVPVMKLLGIAEHAYADYLLSVCIIYGLSSVCQMMILGYEKIATYNNLLSLQTILHFIILCLLFFVFKHKETLSFIWSLHISYTLTLLPGIYLVLRHIKNYSFTNFRSTAKQAVIRGFSVQFGNLVQFLNYRLSLFFLSSHLVHLGVFSISLVLAEAIWLLGNSISLVQYSKISNEKSREKSVEISFGLAKTGFWSTTCCVAVLLLVPEGIYSFVFGPEFGPSRYPTIALGPGIIFIGLAMSFSHYFAGTGNFSINNKAALIGLAVKIPACFLLVDHFKETGAALACTLSYLASLVYLFINFKKATGFTLKDLLVTSDDITKIKAIL